MTTTVAQLLASSSSSNNSKTGNTRKRRDTPTTTTTTARGARPQHQEQEQSARRRRPPQSTQSAAKWRSLLMLALIMAQLQELLRSGNAGSGAGLALALAAPAATAAAAATAVAPPAPQTTPLIDSAAKLAAARQTRRTRRMQKRHESISFKMSFQRELRNTVPDWSNSCGGKWTGPDRSPPPVLTRRQRCLKKWLRTLRNKTRRELVQLRDDNALRHLEHSVKAQDTAVVQAIDISKQDTWSLHNSQYDFLPRVNVSKQLSLRHAHHDLQFYVAAFSYLRHAQLHWDLDNLQKQSVLSAELLRLRNSARLVLCNFEEAYNSSRLHAPNHRPLRTVKRVPMERKLRNLKTPLVELHRRAVLAAHGQPTERPREPNSLDLRFVKYQYIQYLKHMTKLLAKQSKRNCKATKANKTNTQPPAG
ncbi:uncharacterized protein LOC115565007 [Drosophila navojoa]|uniref:uncharacterized protein LOC115565007 n=1 Tax=Drosophila navojoa TaxID=7232 RepID=UPI0011BE167B|nr:uncharacterized protein LOC115565007 [Drosophila navojoa]